ncbi:tRNA 5-methylaminomethyl-2-thiouridine biosynthesis bifunctional protein MnmC [Saliniradius amylolyticus]|uniref:tRNA 5-methylaminomethyl-2-thiouridine biosynthesis bifunctional protein MnmC n=1 Tax=Saliniradius amylolyticus TaxID=2183582 RepID=A0A2S2E446_9ALTE|nr:bifunctional tRNA (5-methylaminomethyl-2-thiouridine)(34)-methyltransferase MnmD/FAD-dependent 5-carboxymethylaminomethyl-2-thiouridine(34) oxidoreductase MnmC [Saliniradius amylolyticus]AWL12428.1 tRNA 5-methylaminomethyl-2-thiouridine biosynthesis bifunctional protein MnmC [Saliniradius amylolyticus]
MSLETARLHFNEQGTPVAESYDDVYFSNANGLEESRFVFIHNNGLSQRWCQYQLDEFCIAETGFGTGLNFLASWQAFGQFRRQQPDSPLTRLRFISTEKHPISAQDLATALARWPELADYSRRLQANYPSATYGCHRLHFFCNNYEVVLDLWLGDLHQLLPQMECPKQGLVDAWFLDGFAPSKNPDMWTDELFSHMARLGKDNSTFATFTAAGFVRRGLQEAGFDVKKVPGFGRKREMLAGTLTVQVTTPHPQPWFCPQAATGREVCIIGAGLAGANLAYSLVQQGYRVRVFTKGIADGASGNTQGGFYPQLHAQANTASLLMAQGFEFARRRYAQLLDHGHTFEHQFCGVLQLGFNANSDARLQNLLSKGIWPETLLKGVSAERAEELAGLPLPYSGIFFKYGGWINPAQLVRALFDACGEYCQLYSEHELASLEPQDKGWRLEFSNGLEYDTEILVLASGAEGAQLDALADLPLRPVRGQVESVPSQGQLNNLKTVLCHKGYLTPALNNRHALGSTYIKGDVNTEARISETESNLSQQAQALKDCDWAQQIGSDGQARASVRLSTPDHLPLVGRVPDYQAQREQYQTLHRFPKAQRYTEPEQHAGLYVLTGFGSRALCTAPLAAEALACQIGGKALPLTRDQLAALSPNRFLIRELIRG